jgi:hypothetical protein
VRRFLLVLTFVAAVAAPTAAFADTTVPAPDTAPTPMLLSASDSGVASATTTPDLTCAKPGVERPNCGVKPTQAGDRGGALQYTVWAVLVLALILIFTVVFRSAARTDKSKKAEVGDRDWS